MSISNCLICLRYSVDNHVIPPEVCLVFDWQGPTGGPNDLELQFWWPWMSIGILFVIQRHINHEIDPMEPPGPPSYLGKSLQTI